MTTDDTPIVLETPIVRQGGGASFTQSIPETRPGAPTPLSFNPNNPVAPTTVQTPVTNPQSLSKEKLEKLYQQRQQKIDMTLQTMDQ